MGIANTPRGTYAAATRATGKERGAMGAGVDVALGVLVGDVAIIVQFVPQAATTTITTKTT